MSRKADGERHASRRGFLAATAGLAAAAATGFGAGAATENLAEINAPDAPGKQPIEPFWGAHQGGIATPAQSHTYFAAFDLTTTARRDVAALLQAWTSAAARMTDGHTAQPLGAGLKPVAARGGGGAQAKGYGADATPDASTTAADSGEALGLPPARLTLTFGFGAGLFVKDGKDRFGLAARRPQALVDMPHFVSDQLVPARTGGDLSVQACADDPQVAFHAVRQLARIADDVAQIRWVQAGFKPGFDSRKTPRNLMGFRDGTDNPSIADPKTMADVVWVGGEGPGWMRGGSYVVARRIRIALEHWDRMNVAFQEQTIGRDKYSGAPPGGKNERDPVDLKAVDKDGNPLIAENAHVRLAAAASNGGAQILRRPYSYNDGVDLTAERWPPWRQAMEYDAGLFFVAYQRDPRTGFIKIYERMSKFDMLNQFVTHVGGGLFAVPRRRRTRVVHRSGPVRGRLSNAEFSHATHLAIPPRRACCQRAGPRRRAHEHRRDDQGSSLLAGRNPRTGGQAHRAHDQERRSHRGGIRFRGASDREGDRRRQRGDVAVAAARRGPVSLHGRISRGHRPGCRHISMTSGGACDLFLRGSNGITMPT